MTSHASMVATTTVAKEVAPMPGSMVAILPRRTSVTRIDYAKISIIDQRPTDSIIRYRVDVLWRVI